MAQLDISNIRKIEKQRNTIHSKVKCTYTIFENSRNKYVQIDTYGNIDREIPEKISQSIQFDRKTAIFLSQLLIEEFNIELTEIEFV